MERDWVVAEDVGVECSVRRGRAAAREKVQTSARGCRERRSAGAGAEGRGQAD